MQVIPTAMLRRFDILCVSLACALAYKYNEEATDASEAQTADLGKSFDAQKEETSAKAFERQKQVLDDDMKEATVAMKPIKTVTAAASEAQKVVFALLRSSLRHSRTNIYALLWLQSKQTI